MSNPDFLQYFPDSKYAYRRMESKPVAGYVANDD
jgi:hypothetical protein